MKKLLWLGLWVIIFTHGSVAQQLVKAEYFFDTDPGFGNGTSIALPGADSINFNTTISTSGLNTGYHQLYFRVKNNLGQWSHYEGRLFYIIENGLVFQEQPSLVQAEYFFDTDPGLGNGQSVSFSSSDSVNLLSNIPTNGLAPGFHNLFVRVKNNNGKWSHYEGRMFYVVPPAELQVSQATLVKGEYFFDTDPGLGNGTGISFNMSDSINQSLSIPTTGLGTGVHYVFLRVKNDNGKWSHYEGRRFEICNSVIPGSVSLVLPQPSQIICSGHPASFTLNSTNAGDQASYQWTLNGSEVSTQSSYQNQGNLQNGDMLGVSIVSSLSCVSPNPFQSSLNLAVTDTVFTFLTDTICVNQSYTLPNGTTTSQAGTYTFYFSAVNSCDSVVKVDLQVDLCTGFENGSNEGDLAIYPNPNHGEFQMVKSKIEEGVISIYNSLGQIVYSNTLQAVNQYSIKIYGVLPGLYTLIFQTTTHKNLIRKLSVY